MGLKGFQIIQPAGGTQMSRADNVVWHVMGKPWKYDTSSVGALCIIQIMLTGANPEESLHNFACVSLFCVIYLVRLWATQCIASNGTLISEEWTGKYVGGVGHVIISNNTSVLTFNQRSKENLHLHEE